MQEKILFNYNTTIKLHDTDAAGPLFFGNLFKIAHDAYESFMESKNLSLARLLKEANFILPIVHAEADYRLPLFVGDKLFIKIQCVKIGKSSFTLLYDFFNKDNKAVGLVQTVHVAVSNEQGGKISLPEKIKMSLNGEEK